jgi:7-carboxy-7-deazaguanine synthase
MSVSEIIEKVENYGCKRVCVTGGEPLLQKEVLPLMQQLCDQGYNVSLETSGDKDCGLVDPRVLKVIDVKTPDSGEGDTFNLENLKYANVNTEFKFVITSKRDFDWSVNFAIEHHLFSQSTVYFSPSFNSISPHWLAEEILRKKLPLRLQLQMHKYIWDSETRGV